MCHTHAHTHTHTHTILTYAYDADRDYDALTNYCLGPFSGDVRELSFNVSIVDDNTPERAEMFHANLTLDPADQARLGNRVTVSHNAVTVTIQDNDGKL